MTHTPFPATNQRTITFESITVSHHSAIIKCILLAVLLFALPTAASAQDKCATIGSDPEWAAGLKQIVDTMQAEDWQTAKQQAKSLSLVCPHAPVLNYLRGKIAEQLGEKQDALYFFQNASESTYTFAVDPETAKKIWYARYENEHPERTASALTTNNEKLQALETALEQSRSENEKLQEDIKPLKEIELEHNNTTKALMWSGVGVAAGGLALAGTGVALLMISHSSEITKDDIGYQAKDSPLHATGWILSGVGAGLLITGAVLTGVFGYKYTHSITDNDISFNISPTGLYFNMIF